MLQAPEVPFVRGVAVHATTGLPAPMDLDLAFDRAPDALHDLPEQVTAALPASSLECRRRNVLVREDGTFEFAAPSGALPATLHLPVRSLLVDVHPQSVGHDTRDLRITEPLTDLRLVVFALPSIEGRVVTVDGAPVLDADVQMELEFVSPDDPSLAWQLRGSAPDFPQRDGTFHAWCGNPPAGRRHADLPKLLDPRALRRVHFDIARAGRLAGTKVTVERAAMIDTWNVGDLRLDALRRIEFVARSLDGTPIDGAVAADLSAGTPSGEDGHGWIVVDEGVTHVEVGKLGWRPVRVPLRVDSASPLEVVLEPDNVLTCVVRSQTGELRPGVQVRLKSGARPFEREDWRHTSACLGATGASQLRRARQFDDGSFEVGAQTDDRGCVAFGGLTSGIALRIDVLGPTGEPLARATTRVGVDERASVELRLVGDVTFRGRVVDEEGAPLADAFVLLRDTDGGSCGAAPSDFRGRFEIPDLVPGRATVEVQRVGFERYTENGMDLTAEALIRLRTEPAFRARGR
ncbi:MAG: carboxypeptidase regulatory-like domain-containing protein [Planctomycetes bacterium]|nr:carboxypeptidase regulatory-like domain-containing protein [Planctomycetota bacterium]